MTKKFSSNRRLTDLEEAEIQEMIASDPDNPELTSGQIAQGRSFKDALPELHRSIVRSRGRPRVENPKEAVTLRLDPKMVSRMKEESDDWRTILAVYVNGIVLIHPMAVDDTGALIDGDVHRYEGVSLDDAILEHFGNGTTDHGSISDLLGSAAFVDAGKVEQRMVYRRH